jgi:hypothetical protein
MLQQVEAFTYLGVEISARGIEEESFIRRRIEGTEKAAVALGRLGANIGGFSTRTCSLLYRTFLRSKLEAGLCIIGQTAGRKQKVESCQQRMMARLMGVGPKTSGAIMRGLLGLPKMSARWNQLRIGYVRRVERLKGLDYLVETALKDSGKMKKLGGRMPAREVTLGQLATKALEEVGKEAAGATGGHLKLGSLRKGAWFLRSGRLGRQESRMINLWLMKKLPSRPVTCRHCGKTWSTQEHVITCSGMLGGDSVGVDLSGVPARWRVEAALSSRETALEVIASEISRGIEMCLPQWSGRR